MIHPPAKTLGLFLTRGISLAKWDKIGILEREVEIYKRLASSFASILIFSYGLSDDKYHWLLPRNVRIINKPRFFPSFLYSFFVPFIHAHHIKEIGILKTNQMDGSWAAVISKKMFGNKLIVRCGYEWLQYLENTKSTWRKKKIAFYVEDYAYTNADKIIISSEGGKKFIKDRFSIRDEKIKIIPNYVDTEKFKPDNLKKNKKRIIFVGRLEPVKNILNLVYAMSGIDAELVIVGEGSQKNKIQEAALENKVKIDFRGIISQNELPDELNLSSIFILPSLSEGNPKSLLEAMSCGLACIGSNVEGIAGIIKDKENGIICDTSAESINQSIKLLLGDDELRFKISENARKSILECFSTEKVLEKELSLYELL